MSTYLSKRFDFGSSFSSIGSAVTCRAVVCLALIAARQCLPSCGCSARLLTAIGIYEIFLVCLLILMSQRGRGSPHGACATSHTGSRHLSRSVCVCVYLLLRNAANDLMQLNSHDSRMCQSFGCEKND